ncbi:unnamed protein product [Chrysoparadoxa australica]
MEQRHHKEMMALQKRLRIKREKVKQGIPLSGRLKTTTGSWENFKRLGRTKEAEKVKQKLTALEKQFWSKALSKCGFTEYARSQMKELTGRHAVELSIRDREERVRAANEAREEERMRRLARVSKLRSSDRPWTVWYAAKVGELTLLRNLLERNPKRANKRDLDTGWPPLHFAAKHGQLEAIECLMEYGASLLPIGPEGWTSLHLAAGWGTYESCVRLLQLGADKHSRSRKDGSTSMDLAIERERPTIVKLLQEWCPIGLTVEEQERIAANYNKGSWQQESDTRVRRCLKSLWVKEGLSGKAGGGTSVDLCTTLARLAAAYIQAGRLDEGREVLERLLPLTASTRGDTSHEYMTCLGQLGKLSYDMGALNDAKLHFEKAVDVHHLRC